MSYLEHPPGEPTAGADGEEARRRYRAAISAIETLALNLRTIRRGTFPAQAKRRIREILRLAAETQVIIARELDEVRPADASIPNQAPVVPPEQHEPPQWRNGSAN